MSFAVKTQGDVARFFGVNVQTIKEWKKMGMPGDPGHWPLDSIARWRITRADKSNGGGERKMEPVEMLKAAKLNEQVKLLKLQLGEKEGQLIDVDMVSDFIVRAVTEHNAHAEQLAERIRAVIPRNVKAEDRERIIRTAEKAVDNLRRVMADMADNWDMGRLDDAGTSEDEEAEVLEEGDS